MYAFWAMVTIRSATSRGCATRPSGTCAVNALRGWSADELFDSPEGWEPDALVAELTARFPDGASPPGMMAGMQSAGGRSLQSAD